MNNTDPAGTPGNQTGLLSPTPDGGPGQNPSPATSDLALMIQNAVTAATKPLNDQISQLHSKMNAASGGAVRDRFIMDKMSDVPETYRSKMPDTSDMNELLKHEQNIRAVLRDDMKKMGFKSPDVGGGNPGGLSPIHSGSLLNDKRTPTDLVMEGLKTSGRSQTNNG